MARPVTGIGLWAALMVSMTTFVAAEERRPGTLIEDVLPPYRISAEICLEGRFTGKALDVDDWHHPIRGTRPAQDVDGLPSLPTQMRDQPVRRVQLYLKQIKREFAGDDRLYEFKVLVEVGGVSAPMVGSGDCSYRSRRHVMDESWTLEPTTTSMRCGIDCDGGGMDLSRVAGSGEIELTFGATGIRMSGACFGANFRIGALRRDAVTAEPLAEQPKPPAFRLHRTSAKSCTTLARWKE